VPGFTMGSLSATETIGRRGCACWRAMPKRKQGTERCQLHFFKQALLNQRAFLRSKNKHLKRGQKNQHKLEQFERDFFLPLTVLAPQFLCLKSAGGMIESCNFTYMYVYIIYICIYTTQYFRHKKPHQKRNIGRPVSS
jgi:hypothetical protein